MILEYCNFESIVIGINNAQDPINIQQLYANSVEAIQYKILDQLLLHTQSGPDHIITI
jgi:hypothetical protein